MMRFLTDALRPSRKVALLVISGALWIRVLTKIQDLVLQEGIR